MKQVASLAIIAALRASLVECRGLRHRGYEEVAERSLSIVNSSSLEPTPSKEIHAKWDKMDEFLKIMFTIACKAKHGKDIDGLAAEKLKEGEIEHTELGDFKKDLHQENLVDLVQDCGMITANGAESCRAGCGERWGNKMEKRSDCDRKCVTTYKRFEKSCKGKAEHLEKVYGMKLKAAAARKTCFEGFCEPFPTVWMISKEADMAAERDELCKKRCTKDQIKVSCEQKWRLTVDFKTADITQACHDEGKVKECFSKKKADEDKKHSTCDGDGKKSCGGQFDECTKKGGKDGEAMCTERRDMCEKQVTKKCLDDHKVALGKAQDDCEKTDAEAASKCESEKLTKAQEDHMKECEADRAKSCPGDCKSKCKTDKLHTCIGNLKSDHDPAGDFCEDFWTLLHDSSEVDPVTGDPIVLLQK